jgi:hypothetical protein
MGSGKQLLFLEFNEVNFESVDYYARQGRLPHLHRLIEQHGWQMTTSEQRYEELEPWIQWVTAHTGLTLSQHGVFRLGDIANRDLEQIWEQLESEGLKVGAISPMNAKHRLKDPAFFVPDPWTPTAVTAPKALAGLYRALAQAVNDNAQSRITLSSALQLLLGTARYARPANYPAYLGHAVRAVSCPWHKALFLDLLLADVFVREVRRTQPNFATLFLNAAAHIQHHYMFCSKAYGGPHRNPTWYVHEEADPVVEVYELYDHILGEVCRAFPHARLMLATGLHQVPHSELTYYWRLKDHAAFLRKLAVDFLRVEPRMSRDFLITCADRQGAARVSERLQRVIAADGTPLFEVDNRGADLFVMLVYPREITEGFVFALDGVSHHGFHKEVAFVALKNGEHHGAGYFLDSGASRAATPSVFPLHDIPSRIRAALGLTDVSADAA